MSAVQPGGEVLLYRKADGAPAIEVQLDADTVWLSQQQIADLFQTTQQNVSQHLQSVYDEGELSEGATHKDLLLVRREGSRDVRRKVAHYNLDAIISVGYRVKSKLATQFRIWATERLREYLVKGFTMDDERLKNLGGGVYWRELLERVREIRSSEKVLYRQVLDLYATSVDYDPHAEESKVFFATVQNKLHFAAHGHTAAEVIRERADASKENMGLTHFKGERPRKSEVIVAKNYLAEGELRRLNTLVSAYFDAAEFRAQNHEPTYMADWMKHLDGLITAMGAKVLPGAGSMSRSAAETHAKAEWDKYRSQADGDPASVETEYLESIKNIKNRIEGNL